MFVKDYYPFGAVLRSYNASDVNNKYKFTEKERDVETGYDYFGARFYDSDILIWLQVDPLWEKTCTEFIEVYHGWSPYNYVLNNPLRYFDPDGKEVSDPITLSAAGATAVVIGVGVVITAGVMVTYQHLHNPSTTPAPTNINITLQAVKLGVDVVNTITSWFSSDAKSDGNVKEQSTKISEEIGKNSVTLPDGTRVDLKGRGHKNEDGQKVETPHTHEAEPHTNPKTGETFTKTKKIPRPTTQKDLDKVKEVIKKQN